MKATARAAEPSRVDLYLAAALFAIACIFGIQLTMAFAAPTSDSVAPQGVTYASDRFLVRFQPGAKAEDVRSLNAANRASEIDSIDALRVKVMRVPTGKTVAEMVEIYSKNPNVTYAEPDYVVQGFFTPNDPYYSYESTVFGKVSAPQAWDISTGSTAVSIAIIDTGVDKTHPDFAGRIGSGYDFVNNDSDATDDQGHGTMAAGVAAASGNNGVGVAGMDWRAVIRPVKVLNSSGSGYTSNVAKGLTWAADQGIRVMSMSLGGPADSTLQNAVSYALGKGSVIVAATGNDSRLGVSYPAAYAGVIGVGALNGDTVASFSNYGPQVDVVAPGVNVYTAARGSRYAYFSGTSAATPFVAGLAALELAVNPLLTGTQAAARITGTATDLGSAGWDQYYGYGRINAYAALNGLAPAPAPAPEPTSTPVPVGDTVAPGVAITFPAAGARVSGTTAINVAASDNVGVTKVEIYVDGGLGITLTAAPYSANWNTKYYGNGSHTITAKAYDAAGNSTSASVTVNVWNRKK